MSVEDFEYLRLIREIRDALLVLVERAPPKPLTRRWRLRLLLQVLVGLVLTAFGTVLGWWLSK